MKRLKIFIFAIFVTVASGCSSNMSSNDSSVACLGEECTSADCLDQQLVSSKDGMLDFCQSPAFGTFAIEKDGITWHFGESVSYGQFVNGDYWVLDKGNGVKITKVTPGPTADRHGSMINPAVGVQAYDNRIYNFDPSQGVSFPAVLKGGDSLVSTVSVTDSDLNQYGNVYPSWYNSTKGLGHASLMNASVLTVVSEVPKTGSFRPPYVGDNKKIYNISDIKRSLLPKIKAPASIPDVSYFERGVERPWLMHMPGWTAREMHPVENMRNYHRDIGNFLSDLSLILLTDAATNDLLYGFLQTGIDHYYTIINGGADSATFEFHSILTGILLGDEAMARVWVDGRSQTGGRAAEKFYFADDMSSNISSSIVKSGESWTGFKVMFRKQAGNSEHEHLHPSEWDKVDNGGGRKQENYRHCCDSKPHFGMALTSRILKAEKYWPSSALDTYLDRWIWESKNGYGYEEITKYYSFDPEYNGTGERRYILASQFMDDLYLGFGYSPDISKPTASAKPQPELEPLPEPEPEIVVEESESANDSSSASSSSGTSSSVEGSSQETAQSEEQAPTEDTSLANDSDSTPASETGITGGGNVIEDDRPLIGDLDSTDQNDGATASPEVTGPADSDLTTTDGPGESTDTAISDTSISPEEQSLTEDTSVSDNSDSTSASETGSTGNVIEDDRPLIGDLDSTDQNDGATTSPEVTGPADTELTTTDSTSVSTDTAISDTSTSPEEKASTEGTTSVGTGEDSSVTVTTNEGLVSEQAALTKSLKKGKRALRKAFVSERDTLKSAYLSGTLTLKQYRKQKRALKQEFEANKAVLQEAYEVDNAILLETYGTESPSNIIEDSRALPGS